MDNQTDMTREQLKADLKKLADTLDELVQHSGTASKAELDSLKAKAEAAIADARVRLDASSEQILSKTKDAAQCCDQMVRDNPWTGIGIGAAVGVLLGVLLARR